MNAKRPLGVPEVFRVLVIDDQICNDAVCRQKVQNDSAHVKDLIRHYIQSVVKDVALRQTPGRKIKVEVDFAKDPNEGVGSWMESVYDLTLVDSDFSRDETMRQKIDERHKRNFLDLNLEFAGAYLYRFFCEMLSGKEFRNTRKGCRVALWTGLGLGDSKKVDRAKRLISILPEDDTKCLICFIPKKECDIRKWQGLAHAENKSMSITTIATLLDDMSKSSPVFNPDNSNVATTNVIIGRIKSLYRIKSAEEFSALCGIGEYVYVSWLKEENGTVVLSDDRIDGGKLLSPLLRRDEDNDDFEIVSSDSADAMKRKREMAVMHKIENDFFPKTLLDIRRKKHGIVVPNFGKKQEGEQDKDEQQDKIRQKWKEHIIAAATPLTGCSAVGRDYSIDLMVKKIAALLDGPFGKVVLKTVYLDSLSQWKDKKWPEVQAQESHLTRCLRSTRHTRTLWNTGQTSMEAFTPEMMHDFLAKVPNRYRNNIIVSLGSKFPQAKQKTLRQENCENKLLEIWNHLFAEVFNGIDNADYKYVEINVRHYLRECIEANLGGHEYLSPAKISEPFTCNYEATDREFKTWLSVLNATAKQHDKKLLLKLPFRGDILHFISVIREFVVNGGTNIVGITLINAFKSAAGETEYGAPYSPASYTKPDDSRKWRYQMSGEMLAASRNELIGEITALANDTALANEAKGFQIHLSGGIVDKTGLEFCLNCGKNIYAQIGTWALMDLNLEKQNWCECQKDAPSIGSGKPQVLGCKLCRTCQVNCPSGAFNKGSKNGAATIDRLKCTACQKCIGMCIWKCVRLGNEDRDCGQSKQAEQSSSSDELSKRIAFCIHELCNGCGKCSRTFYCDTFMDRRGLELPPIMDARNCTGCGLCAQTCPRGAIQLFRPEHVAVLIGDNAADLRRWHKFLFANEIPHLVFDSTKQLDVIKSSFLGESIIITATNKPCSLDGLDAIKNEVEQRLEFLRETR